MKYLLIIFIFTSFLFSQASMSSYDSSIGQAGVLDGEGRPISARQNSPVIQYEQQQVDNGAFENTQEGFQNEALDGEGRPISARQNSPVIQYEQQQVDNGAFENTQEGVQNEALDGEGRPK